MNDTFESRGLTLATLCDMVLGEDAQDRSDAALLHGVRLLLERKKPRKSVAMAPPSLDEVMAYCKERGGVVDPCKWYEHYLSNGWMVGRVPMKDWKACVRYWERSGFNQPQQTIAQIN